MSKFYTNIEQRGDHILYMGWENGMSVKQKIKYKPHLFIQSKDNQKTEYTSFSTKKYLSRVDFDSIHDMKEYVKTYSDISNFEIYGCSDIIRQFTRSMFGSDEISWDYSQTKIWFFDIETRVEGMTIDPSGSYQIRVGDEIFTRGYSDIMQMLEDSLRFDFFEDGKFVPVKESKDYRAGFPNPEKAEQEILLISMVDHHKEKLYVWSVKPVSQDNKIFEMGADFRSFETEKAMLKDFLLFWKSNRIDVISGWNSEIFDIPYLINRMKRVLGDDLTNHMSPWNVVKERRYVEMDKEYQTYELYGITHLDYLIIYKKFNPGSKESFKLDYIAEYELGEKKVENPTDNFRDFYLEHWEIFTFYNSIDVMLLHKMEHKKLLVRLAMQLAFIGRCNFGDVVSAMRLWESIIYNYFTDIMVIEDYNKKSNKKDQIVGAYVHEPKPGKTGWTVSLDFASLYPSIMMQNNISPETIVDHLDFFIEDILAEKHFGKVPDGCILSANGLLTSKKQKGFIPILIKRMFDLRKQTKKMMLELKKEQQEIKEKTNNLVNKQEIEYYKKRYDELDEEISALDVAQSSYKVAANSFYGIMGLPYFKYYDSNMAEGVTATGQVSILTSKKIINGIISKIVGKQQEYVTYCDTDSAYVNIDELVKKHCKGKSDKQIVDFVERFVIDIVQPELNKQLSAFAKTMGIDECLLDMKLECIGPSLIMVAKKKYMFDILYSEGVRYSEPKMKVMGIEIVRSSTPSIVKDYLKKAAKICLSGDEKSLQEYVNDVKVDFMKQPYYSICFPRGVNGMKTYSSSSSIYVKGCPIHVRAASLYNYYLKKMGLDSKYPLIADGDKIKFVYLKKPNHIYEDVIAFPTKLPEELDLIKYIDKEMQFEKTFLKPLESISSTIGWHTKEQPSLDSLFD